MERRHFYLQKPASKLQMAGIGGITLEKQHLSSRKSISSNNPLERLLLGTGWGQNIR